jgi:hypothetical protein
MTLPTIPDLPQQPAPTLDQQLAHLSLLMRVREYEQRERLNAEADRRNAELTTAHGRLAAAQESVAGFMPQQLAFMQQLLEAPPAPAAAGGDGLTAGDVAIVKGIVDAVRPAQG